MGTPRASEADDSGKRNDLFSALPIDLMLHRTTDHSRRYRHRERVVVSGGGHRSHGPLSHQARPPFHDSGSYIHSRPWSLLEAFGWLVCRHVSAHRTLHNENEDHDDDVPHLKPIRFHAVVACCLPALRCRMILAGSDIIWKYGKHYRSQRMHVSITALYRGETNVS